jgi:DNA modification methylase
MKIKTADVLQDLTTYNEFEFNTIFCDPPYQLGSKWVIDKDGTYQIKGKPQDFMNKWDGLDGPALDTFFKESFRTLKYGGYLLMFGMDRQLGPLHYYAVKNGFEINQSLYWYFVSSFPKATDAFKQIRKRLINNKKIEKIWNNLKIVNVVENKLEKNQTEVGTNIERKNTAPENVVLNQKTAQPVLDVQIVELKQADTTHTINLVINFVPQSVGVNITQEHLNVTGAEKKLQDQNVNVSQKNYIVQKSVIINLSELTLTPMIKEDEVLKIENGENKFLIEENINVICVEIIQNLKHTILNQLKTILNYDTTSQMEDAYAISVTTTKSIMDNLITNTVSMLEFMLNENENDLAKVFDGYKYSKAPLKQMVETICVFSKPTKNKSVLDDLIEWGEDVDLLNYAPKVGKKERDMGCEDMPDKRGGSMMANEGSTMDLGAASLKGEPKKIQPTKNTHPTLKPIKLISEIAKLFKLPDIVNQKVYIPFAGSFSEVIGFVDAGYNHKNITACEMNPEYVEIGKKRIKHFYVKYKS